MGPASSLLLLLLPPCCCWGLDGSFTEMKLVRGAPLPTATIASVATPAPFREPAAFSGPAVLKSLTQLCVSITSSSASSNSWEYVICPFQNVTQREIVSYSSGFWGILGIWDGWERGVKPGGPGKLIYSDGTETGCGKRRKATVTLECNEMGYSITGISEPVTCEYALTLHCPEACEPEYTAFIGLASSSASVAAPPVHSPSVSASRAVAFPTVSGAAFPTIACASAHAAPGDSGGSSSSSSSEDDLRSLISDLRRKFDRLEELVVSSSGAASPARSSSGWAEVPLTAGIND